MCVGRSGAVTRTVAVCLVVTVDAIAELIELTQIVLTYSQIGC